MTNREGWTQEPLWRVAYLTMGQSPESRYYSEEEVGLPFLQGCAEFAGQYPKAVLYCSEIKKLAKRGSTLFSVRAPVGRTNIADQDYVIGRGLAAITSIGIDQGYLAYYLRLSEDDFRNASQGSTFEAINSTDLSNWPITFPTDPREQTQIAAILSTIDKAIEQTEAIIAKQQRIKTGLMQDLLTRGIDEHGNLRSEGTHVFKDSPLGRIPVEWEISELKNVASIIDPNPSHRYPSGSELGVPMASTENFCGENEFDLSFSDRVPFHVYEFQNERCHFHPGDIVFARKGRLGFARFYGSELKVFSHTVVIIKSRKDCAIDSYLLRAVRYPDFFDQISKKMNSNSGVPTLGVEFLGNISIRMPCPDEQNRIALSINVSEKKIESDQRTLYKLRRQKTALMQDLLTGKVRVTALLEASGA